jgi:rhodanese-related sulfurtransferase
MLAVPAFTGCELQQPEGMISYDELKVMMEDSTAMENTTIVDIRPRDACIEGYIESAINIPYDTFIDRSRNLIDDGVALTSIMTDKSRTLIFYGSEDENVVLFVNQASTLGYTDILYYVDGIEDWLQQGNYLIIDYAGFKAWYDAFCRLDDDENYLIDVNPKNSYLNLGHIPGAINIVSNYFVTKFGEEASDITLADLALDKNNNVIMYCYADY